MLVPEALGGGDIKLPMSILYGSAWQGNIMEGCKTDEGRSGKLFFLFFYDKHQCIFLPIETF